MVYLKFGPSNFAMNSPQVSGYGLKNYNFLFVPERENLLPIEIYELSLSKNFLSFMEFNRKFDEFLRRVKPSLTTILDRPSVVLDLRELNPKDELYLMWIKERKWRGEWIGVIHSSWLESDAWGTDESYRGPFSLNTKYSEKILEAYGFKKTDEKILKKVLTTPPPFEELFGNKKSSKMKKKLKT